MHIIDATCRTQMKLIITTLAYIEFICNIRVYPSHLVIGIYCFHPQNKMFSGQIRRLCTYVTDKLIPVHPGIDCACRSSTFLNIASMDPCLRGCKREETKEERGIEIGRGRVGGESTFQNCRATNASRETKYLAWEQAFGRAGNFPFLAIFSPNREPVHRLRNTLSSSVLRFWRIPRSRLTDARSYVKKSPVLL